MGPDKPYSNIFTGWAYPPRDYGKWAELVYQWARHCVEKYGKQLVESWYWEVWNEPNIAYWKGTPEEFSLCAQVRSGRAPRREFPRSRDLGLRIRGPVLCRWVP